MFTERRIESATPTISTSIYASGDHVGTLMTFEAPISSRGGLVEHVTVIDKSKQKSILNILFFSGSPTLLSADNAALDISDDDMANLCLGYVPIAAADYKDLANSSVATVSTIKMAIERTTTAFYAVILSGGTPTYAGTTDLVIKLGIRSA